MAVLNDGIKSTKKIAVLFALDELGGYVNAQAIKRQIGKPVRDIATVSQLLRDCVNSGHARIVGEGKSTTGQKMYFYALTRKGVNVVEHFRGSLQQH